MNRLIIAFVLSIALFSCNKKDSNVQQDPNSIFGIWESRANRVTIDNVPGEAPYTHYDKDTTYESGHGPYITLKEDSTYITNYHFTKDVSGKFILTNDTIIMQSNPIKIDDNTTTYTIERYIFSFSDNTLVLTLQNATGSPGYIIVESDTFQRKN